MNIKLLVNVVVALLLDHSQSEFSEFVRENINDGNKCMDVLFEYYNTTAVRCMVECARTSECIGTFFFDDLKCMGCSSYVSQASTISSTYFRKKGLHNYLGCFADSSTRVLNGYHFDSNIMTNELCQQVCSDQGFSYAGTQYMYQCFCGNSYNTFEVPNEALCNMACYGNSSQICGAGYRNSIYFVE